MASPSQQAQKVQLIEKLDLAFNSKIGEIFAGKGVCSEGFFVKLCIKIEDALGYYVNNEIDLSDKVCYQFLSYTVPRIVDVFLRRTTKRQHVAVVMGVLRATLSVLARRSLTDLEPALSLKLMELRNLILSGGSTFRFVSLQELELMPGYNSYGLMGEHGKYESCIMNHNIVKFWPHDWTKHLNGENAVGHFICTFVDVRLIDSGSVQHSPRNGTDVPADELWVWQYGQITSYNSNSNSYIITTFPQPKNLPPNVVFEPVEDSFVKRSFVIDLSHDLYTWVDTLFREEVLKFQKETKNVNIESDQSRHSDLLTYTDKDEGQYILIDHLVSGKKYFAKVISFDSSSGRYKVVFDDKTSRELKFQELQKDMNVTVIAAIPENVISSTENRTAGSSAKIVRQWYQSLSTGQATSDSTAAGRSRDVILPEAGSGNGACYLKFDLIECFFHEGGCDSMLQSLSDQSAAPPLLHGIILHMKLIYSFRDKIKSKLFEHLVLKLKDYIPSCVLRFEENNIKYLTKIDISVLIRGLSDIVHIVDVKNIAIKKDMEVLHLSIALKMLQSSQLQKRYLGLSIIREHVEIAMPEILHDRFVLNPRKKSDQGQQNNGEQKRGPPLLDANFMEAFILDNNIYNTIFGESFHQDLALGSDFLLVFLALRGSLAQEHLLIMWQTCSGSHEVVVRVLYRLILHLTPVLHPHLRMSLFEVITSNTQDMISEHYLRFIRDFTVRAIHAFKHEKILLSEPADGESQSTASQSLLLSKMEFLEESDYSNEKSVKSNCSDNDNGFSSKFAGRVRKKNKRIWLGFTVLWRFVQDCPSSDSTLSNPNGQSTSLYHDESIINMAVHLMVDLLREDTFKEEREYVIQRCLLNVQNRNSVAISMKLIRMVLSMYPTPGSGWLSSVKSSVKSTVTVSHMIDKLVKPENGNLVTTIFSEMDSYHEAFKSQIDHSTVQAKALNETRLKVNGKRSKISHCKGLIERLQLLVFILVHSPHISLNTKQVFMLWKVYVDEASTSDISDIFIDWIGKQLMKESKAFDTMYLASILQNSEDETYSPSKLHFLKARQEEASGGINLSAVDMEEVTSSSHAVFADGVLRTLFESKIFPLTQLHADSPSSKLLYRPLMASFCLKLFLFVNSGIIRTDSVVEGWYRTSERLLGLIVVWKIAIDATNVAVHEAASYLLIELHHRIHGRPKEVDDIRSDFLSTCFSEMSKSMQCLQIGEVAQENTAAVDMGVLDSKTLNRRVSRFVGILSTFVKRFNSVSRPYTVLHIVNSRNGLVKSLSEDVDIYRTRVLFPMAITDTIGSVRARVASHFNVAQEVVGLTRISGVKYLQNKENGKQVHLYCDKSDSSSESLEKDMVTLQALKIKPMETIVVKRIENPDNDPGNFTLVEGPVGGSMHLFGKYKKEDIFEIQNLDMDYLPPLNPFAWLGLQTINSTSRSDINFINSTRVFREPSNEIAESLEENGKIDLFALPPSPLPHQRRTCPVGLNQSDGDNITTTPTVLEQYLNKNPEHFSQLLQMLDGYFSLTTDMNGSGPDSAVVWEVIQSLPWYEPLLIKIRKLIPLPDDNRNTREYQDSQRSFLADVFDAQSPYSMLYAMQIIDTILSSTSFKDKNSNSSAEGLLVLGRSQLEWGWKFIKLGGVEYLISILETLMEKWSTQGNSTVNSTYVQPIGEGRADVEVLCIVMLLRLLHKFFLFDVTYSKWQLDPVVKAGAFFPGETMTAFVAAGLLMSYVKIASFYQNIMRTVFSIVAGYNKNRNSPTANWTPFAELQVSTVESLISHSIVLMFGIVKTTDDCVDVFRSFSSIHRFIRAITVRPAEKILREAGCRGLLQAATFILVRSAIPHSNTDTAKHSLKVRRNSRHSSLTIQPGRGIKRPSRTMDNRNRAIVTPMNSLEDNYKKNDSVSEECKSPKRLSNAIDNDFFMSGVENHERQELFHEVFTLVLQSVHPAFDTPNWDSTSHSDDCLGPESYENGEEVYSLLGGLIALQGRPNVLTNAKLEFLSVPRDISTKSSSGKSEHQNSCLQRKGIDDNRLCGLFFEKLITHFSYESFQSREVDFTLTGILRVLLILVDGQPTQRKFAGMLQGKPNVLLQLAQNAASSTHQQANIPESNDHPVNLVEYLYTRCLFPQRKFSQPSPGGRVNAAVCMSAISRKLAYGLLLELCKDDYDNMTTLIKILSKEFSDNETMTSSDADALTGITKCFGKHSLRASQDDAKCSRRGKHMSKSVPHWEYDPNVLVKKRNAYLGLVNQGCTCYMNAFLQQLFHVDSFTDPFLEIDSNHGHLAEDIDAYIKDNTAVLYELQVLFCYLRSSQRKYCDTMSFAKVFKDYDMEPVRLGEQKDINEFASMLFDKLESNEKCKDLIKKKFGGELVWQVTSIDEDCTYKSEREEPYFILTAEVRGKSNLEDSLDLFVAGESLTGDNKIEVIQEEPGGEVTKRKVDAVRRCAIRSLPSVLFIHLKRFDFDLETLNRRKLNDHFTFPAELDMYPYTEEGLQQDEMRRRATSRDENVEKEDLDSISASHNQCKYSLKGVIVHTGAIDSGHYYSFIRVRRQGRHSSSSNYQRESDRFDGDEKKWEWMEFNDTTVSPFSMDSIPTECFGGTAHIEGEQRWKQYSAYMLIYERTCDKDADGLKSTCHDMSSMGATEEGQDISGQGDTEGRRLRTESLSLDCLRGGLLSKNIASNATSLRLGSPRVSPDVLAAVDVENSRFMLELMRFNIDYILFYWKLLQSNVLTETLKIISKSADSATQKTLITRTIYLALVFCFQILFRARAQQCIPPFMEKLEDLVARDESGHCAAALLTEWTRDCGHNEAADDGTVETDSARKSVSSNAPTRPAGPSNISPELLDIDDLLHPMLAIAFVECPHTFTIDAFGRFILWCIKALRRNDFHEHYLEEDGNFKSLLNKIPAKKVAIELGLDDDTEFSTSAEIQQDEDIRNVATFSSCVTRVMCKLLLLIESYQPVDIMNKRNIEVLAEMLRSFVLLGPEEERVLTHLGGVYRIVCSTTVLHPVHLRMPFRDCLRNAIDVACILMRSAVIPQAHSPSASKVIVLEQSANYLSNRDVKAFMSRMFLEMSLNISHPDSVRTLSTYSANFLDALKNMCDQFPANDVIKFFGFFLDKIFDNMAPTLPRTKLINDQIDLSFGVLSQLIIHLLESLIRKGKESTESYMAARGRIEFILDQILGWIITQTARICQRKSAADAPFVNKVMKLLYRIGFQNELGFKSVMRMKDQWQLFSKVYCKALSNNIKPGPPTENIDRDNQSQPSTSASR